MTGRALLPALLLLLLFCLARAERAFTLGGNEHVIVQPSFARLPQPAQNGTAALLVQGGDAPVALKLCECERATGAPNGLSCDKEGWFISSFERQGQWVAGGGYVPLSRAICCRPCLPDELPADPSGRIPGGQSPLAVISLGCHASTDRTLPTRCEERAGSFVSGFSEGIKVFSTPDTFYPINTVQCCTPALLLGNGDAWELERCGCHDSTDPDFPVNCGGTNTDELLLGYIFFRLSPLGHIVPVGPAQCCKACLSGTVHPMNQCDDLNGCSGHGVCNMRRCECFDGWTGADCSQAQGSGNSIPPWAIALIVLSSSALAGILIIAAGFALQALGIATGSTAGSEDGDGDARQPLLIRIDADDVGSVGSADTSDGEDEVEVEEVERRVNRVIQRLERATTADSAPAADGGEAAEGEAGVEAGAAAAQGADAAGDAAGDAGGDGGVADGGTEPDDAAAAAPADAAAAAVDTAAAAAAAVEGPDLAGEAAGLVVSTAGTAEAPASEAPAAPAAGDEAPAEPEKPAHSSCGPTPEGPLAMVDCTVCMSRPVQVVLIPCGHCCCCRRCSRRLNRCPMCRKDIARRQRLFV